MPNDISADRVREIFNYDPETGKFTHRKTRAKCRIGDEVGCIAPNGYVVIGADWGKYAAHRLAWLYVHGRWPNGLLDHINCDRSDNRLCNLREVSFVENSENQRSARSDNKASGLLGVVYNRPKNNWRAKIQVKGRSIHIGLFNTPEEAHAAYVAAKRRLHVGCTL